ncbi:MAG: response regulator [Desulfobacterales bacterium]|nr:response regulator [Desulfobacterales bacterium]
MIKKILIVDDSPIARKMLNSSLPKDKNYETMFGVNGEDGVVKFQEFQPDVTFLDLTMPIMDGYKALEEIRKLDKNAIVIVTTADIQPKSIATVMELGAFTLLKKPAKSKSIEETLEKIEVKLSKIAGE